MIASLHPIEQELHRWFSKSILTDDLDFSGDVLADAVDIFTSDYQRYFPNASEIDIGLLLTRAELQGILMYRLARQFFLRNESGAADKCSLLGRYLSGFEIYYSAEIGTALKINHGLGTVLGARIRIGNNALIHQGVTLGDKDGGRPVLGNDVCIYAGAKILGAVTIGDRAVIGANCVCFVDVPDDRKAVGVPAKIIEK